MAWPFEEGVGSTCGCTWLSFAGVVKCGPSGAGLEVRGLREVEQLVARVATRSPRRSLGLASSGKRGEQSTGASSHQVGIQCRERVGAEQVRAAHEGEDLSSVNPRTRCGPFGPAGNPLVEARKRCSELRPDSGSMCNIQPRSLRSYRHTPRRRHHAESESS